MKTLVVKYPIISFLLINYIISWSFLYPSYRMILANDGITPLSLIGLIGAYGPTIAAIIIQYIIDKQKLKLLLKKYLKFKVGWNTYFFIFIIPILVYILAYLISFAYYSEHITFNIISGISSIPIWILLALPFGPLGEELGWRGFMLPRLLASFSPLKSSVIIGLAWGLWHLASFTFPGAAIPEFFIVNFWTIGLYFINTIVLSLLFTYFHLKSSGSVFVAIMLHACFNASANIAGDFLGETESKSILIFAYLINILIVGLIALLLLKKEKKLIW